MRPPRGRTDLIFTDPRPTSARSAARLASNITFTYKPFALPFPSGAGVVRGPPFTAALSFPTEVAEIPSGNHRTTARSGTCFCVAAPPS